MQDNEITNRSITPRSLDEIPAFYDSMSDTARLKRIADRVNISKKMPKIVEIRRAILSPNPFQETQYLGDYVFIVYLTKQYKKPPLFEGLAKVAETFAKLTSFNSRSYVSTTKIVIAPEILTDSFNIFIAEEIKIAVYNLDYVGS